MVRRAHSSCAPNSIYVCMCMCTVCVCVFVYIYVCIYIYMYTYFMWTYIYVLNIPIFCAIWLRKCDFLTENLGIKFIPDPDWPDPDLKWFIPDPTPDLDPAKSSGSDRIRIRIRIHNTVFRTASATVYCTVRIKQLTNDRRAENLCQAPVTGLYRDVHHDSPRWAITLL